MLKEYSKCRFCKWYVSYNGCEAPNYYDVEDDDFYKEIKMEDII